MKRDHLLPIILCGGTGSRLWPLSRESYPKQYLNLIDDSSKTLLEQTLDRLCGIKNKEDPILICNENHRFIVAEQLRSMNVKPNKIILEPFARNTAPAIAIAALKADGSVVSWGIGGITGPSYDQKVVELGFSKPRFYTRMWRMQPS